MPILSDEAVAVIQEAFNEVDTDSSGYIDASEIKVLLDKVSEAEGFEAPSEEAIQARLEQVPTDEPGKLKLEGVIFAIAMMKVLAITILLFAAADADESGKLEAAEIKSVLTNVHEKIGEPVPSDDDLDKMVEEIGAPVEFETFAAFVIPVILALCGVGVE